MTAAASVARTASASAATTGAAVSTVSGNEDISVATCTLTAIVPAISNSDLDFSSVFAVASTVCTGSILLNI